MSKHPSSSVPNGNTRLSPSVVESLCSRRFKLIPPRSGFYPRGERISDSSLYLRIPLKFYQSHLRTCVRLLVEMYLDRNILLDQECFVCEEMRILVSWITSENTLSWSCGKVTRFVRDLCASLGLDDRSCRCPDIPITLMRNMFQCGMLNKKSFE